MGTGYPIVPANGRSRLSVRAVRIVVLATLFVAALLLPAAICRSAAARPGAPRADHRHAGGRNLFLTC